MKLICHRNELGTKWEGSSKYGLVSRVEKQLEKMKEKRFDYEVGGASPTSFQVEHIASGQWFNGLKSTWQANNVVVKDGSSQESLVCIV
ncbi:hypothetical protein AQUCO_06600027v1 [Aquilegia coerulea]|uniref:Uncharacterized protein n=1 Tax=Aquilegia coerulea TaxID=218851 RepID=A0A2G5CC24_AQUCA|nr:hypothetical protein AQUCO_06600027v1 [Aquilegia coerulea]